MIEHICTKCIKNFNIRSRNINNIYLSMGLRIREPYLIPYINYNDMVEIKTTTELTEVEPINTFFIFPLAKTNGEKQCQD